jgi:hypothetical protein
MSDDRLGPRKKAQTNFGGEEECLAFENMMVVVGFCAFGTPSSRVQAASALVAEAAT